jgi:hypothetical protein
MNARASSCAIVLFLAAAVAQAQPLPVGPGLRLNSTTAGDQRNPAASTGFQGATVAVWESFDASGGCWVIRGQRLQAGGQLLGFESEIRSAALCDGGPNAVEPAVAVNPAAAGFVASWGLETGAFVTDVREIQARRFDFFAGPLGPAVTVEQDDIAILLAPGAVAFHPTNGRYNVSWNASYIGTASSVLKLRGRTYEANGNPLTDLFEFAPGVGSSTWTPGGLLAAWIEGDLVRGVPNQVFLRRFNTTGAPVGNPVTVSTLGSPDSVAVASNRNGDSLLVWVADDGAFRGIFARLYDVAGNARTGRFRVSTQLVLDTASPAVASDGTSFLVAWDDGGDPPMVQARLLDANGAAVGEPFLVDPFNQRTQTDPAVAAGPEGRFLVAWEGYWPGATPQEERDILAQSFATAAPLALGQTLAALADAVAGNVRYFQIDVPEGAGKLILETSGGTGNADLLIRRGALPTTTLFDRVSQGTGNAERIEIDSPQPGTWYAGVRAATAYAGLSLSAGTGTVAPGCAADARTMCLNNDRFAVTTTWRTPNGASGAGQAFRLTGDTGYFWFFNSANVEMVVKVLNGCGLNSRYWVFAGGLTDVDVELRVLDTETGTVRTYHNPQGSPFQPIQDTGAFATCP